jgi:hypothetical protein
VLQRLSIQIPWGGRLSQDSSILRAWIEGGAVRLKQMCSWLGCDDDDFTAFKQGVLGKLVDTLEIHDVP